MLGSMPWASRGGEAAMTRSTPATLAVVTLMIAEATWQ